MESEQSQGSRLTTYLFAIVAAVLVIAAASITVLWPESAEEPALRAKVSVIAFYNETLLPPSQGRIVIQLTIDVSNGEDEAVWLDPSDFLLETVDGQMHHFAFRFGNYSVIWFQGAGDGYLGVGADLPAGVSGTLWAPFEIPMNLTLRSLLWKSALGDVKSLVPDTVNSYLVEHYESEWTN
jgi:hypothetical protein